MEEQGFSSMNARFLNASGYNSLSTGENGNKEGWLVQAQPYYHELVNEIGSKDWPGFEKLKLNITTDYSKKCQRRSEKALDNWQHWVENSLGRSVSNLFDYVSPRIIEEIPCYLATIGHNVQAKPSLKKFYQNVLSFIGISPAFDPLASRIMVYFQRRPVLKQKNDKQINTGNQQLDYYLEGIKMRRGSYPHKLKSYLMIAYRFIAENKTGSKENYTTLVCSDITMQDIEEYEEHLFKQMHAGINCPRVIFNKWSALRTFLNYANKMGWSTLNITRQILNTSEYPSQEPKIYSDDELELLLSRFAASPTNTMRDFVLLALLIDSAARINEILDLKFKDIHQLHTLYAISVFAKGTRRTICLSGAASLLLDNYLKSIDLISFEDYVFCNSNGEKVRYFQLWTKFKTLLGIDEDKGAFHRIRHTLITKALENHADPLEVMLKAGHSSLSITSRYSHPRNSFLTQESAKFPQLDSEVESHD
jgi:site-specific recombinase XerD